MLSNIFDWEMECRESRVELKSPDGAWHATIRKNAEGQTVFLSNYDVLSGPYGSGRDTRESLQNFIENCGVLVKKLEKARGEAEKILENRESLLNG